MNGTETQLDIYMMHTFVYELWQPFKTNVKYFFEKNVEAKAGGLNNTFYSLFVLMAELVKFALANI